MGSISMGTTIGKEKTSLYQVTKTIKMKNHVM